jgi:hypothetical protein
VTTAAYRIALPARWRKPALVFASVLAHVVVLGVLGYRHYSQTPVMVSDAPVIFLDIEPRPLLPDEKPRPRPASAPPLVETRPDLSGRTSPLTPLRRLEEEDENTPDPRLVRPAPGAPTAGADQPWQYRPETMSGAVARSLRTSPIGCDMRDGRMSAAEQQLCDDRFNERAGRARPRSGTDNRERDAAFAREGAAAIDRYERRRRPLAGGTGVVGPADCVGSNFGTGCSGAHLDPSLAPDSNENIRTPQREGPR